MTNNPTNSPTIADLANDGDFKKIERKSVTFGFVFRQILPLLRGQSGA